MSDTAGQRNARQIPLPRTDVHAFLLRSGALMDDAFSGRKLIC